MTIGTPEIFKKFPHLQRIFELEQRIKNLKWYQFGLRIVYKNEIEQLKEYGFHLGIQVALEDLEKGLLKK